MPLCRIRKRKKPTYGRSVESITQDDVKKIHERVMKGFQSNNGQIADYRPS